MDARRFWRRECMATRFDSWRAEENRSKGRNLQEFSPQLAKELCNNSPSLSSQATEELGQLTSPARCSPTFRYHA